VIRSDLAYWRPAAVVAVTSPGSRLGHYLIELFGSPTFRVGQVLAWRLLSERLTSAQPLNRSSASGVSVAFRYGQPLAARSRKSAITARR